MVPKGRITIRFLLTFVLVGSLLAIPLSRVDADQHSVSIQDQSDPNYLQKAFAEAAKEFHIPQSILMSVGYNESRWNQHHGQPSTSGGYGIMHLTQVKVPKASAKGDGNYHSNRSESKQANFHTLDEAAHLLGVDPEVLKTDPVQNIRGGAALLAKYAKQTTGEISAQPADWYGAVAKYSGSKNESVAKDFANRVFTTIRQGAELMVENGQHVVLSPKQVKPNKHTVQSLNLKQNKNTNVDCPMGLNCEYIPAAYKQFSNSPRDYGNYDLANRPKDGLDIRYIIIHDTEGSYTSAINTFQGQSYVSAHYLIRSADGKIAEMVRPGNVAWQAGNWYINMHSIGIEHEGFAVEGATWFSEPMYHASAKLVKYLANRYHIPLDREHIIGHDHVPGLSPAAQGNMHWDPATFWDWGHFFDILGGKESKPPKHEGEPWKANGVVTIKPNFQTNQPPVSYQGQQLDPQPSSFVYLRTAPDSDAPLISDPSLHPNGGEGTTAINDWGDKAVTGQHFYRADREGDWSAIYYGGKKAWFYDPNGKNADLTHGMLVTPKSGVDSIPVYGAAYPEDSAYDGTGISESDRGAIHPLPYSIPAGQMYVADGPFKSDYYYAKLYNQPSDNKVVKGDDEYYQISFNHRIAFVKKSDVDLVTVSAADIKEIVQNFDDIGAFTNDQATRALQVHLSAVSHYEDKGAANKVIKHLNGFQLLLDHQQSNDLISNEAYETLISATDTLITKWQKTANN
jgi:N-acetyl-anhydromuramyl-L-alanine amidase AmpD